MNWKPLRRLTWIILGKRWLVLVLFLFPSLIMHPIIFHFLSPLLTGKKPFFPLFNWSIIFPFITFYIGFILLLFHLEHWWKCISHLVYFLLFFRAFQATKHFLWEIPSQCNPWYHFLSIPTSCKGSTVS